MVISQKGPAKSNSFWNRTKDGEGLTRTNHRSNIVETTKDSTDNRHEAIIV